LTEAAGLGVGSALAEARKALGLSHHDVAQQIKFMPRQLEALEAERFEALPGPTIARGMVRTYARFLKLEPDPLLERMAGHVEAPDATPQLAARFSQPVPFSDGGRRSTVLYLALSAGVLVLAGAFLYEWRHERPLAPFVSPVANKAATQFAEAKEAQAKKAEAKKAEAKKAEAKVEKPVVAEKPAAVEKPVVAEKPVAPVKPKPPVAKVDAPAASPALASPVVAAADSAPKSPAGPNRLQLRFEDEAWLEVTNGSGRLLVSSLQPGGTERVVQCSPPCSLVVGNASRVTMTYKGREVNLKEHARQDVARFTLE
jgi:cytoskeleton protein RodZ